jgi:hypothetical protein
MAATAAIANVLSDFNKTAPERLMETHHHHFFRVGTLTAASTSDNALKRSGSGRGCSTVPILELSNSIVSRNPDVAKTS